MEDGLNKKGDGKDFEERLAEALFADDQEEAKDPIRSGRQCETGVDGGVQGLRGTPQPTSQTRPCPPPWPVPCLVWPAAYVSLIPAVACLICPLPSLGVRGIALMIWLHLTPLV